MSHTERRLAAALVRSPWWSRHQSWVADPDWREPDRCECALCGARGGYHEVDVLDWHTPRCPLRLASRVLGTVHPLSWAHRYPRRSR